MFSACSRRDLQLIARHAENITVPAGKVLMQEGRNGDEFFIVANGKAAVTRNGREVAVLGAGDCFGELALLDRAPRNATVTATTDLEVFILGRREFNGLLAEVPTLSHKLMVGMARRLHELDAKA
jgi:CRP-like cAMP-binding protein